MKVDKYREYPGAEYVPCPLAWERPPFDDIFVQSHRAAVSSRRDHCLEEHVNSQGVVWYSKLEKVSWSCLQINIGTIKAEKHVDMLCTVLLVEKKHPHHLRACSSTANETTVSQWFQCIFLYPKSQSRILLGKHYHFTQPMIQDAVVYVSFVCQWTLVERSMPTLGGREVDVYLKHTVKTVRRLWYSSSDGFWSSQRITITDAHRLRIPNEPISEMMGDEINIWA